MSVAIEGRYRVPMKPAGDGWFEAEATCGAGTRYRYRLADGTAVPDPAARGQDRRRPWREHRGRSLRLQLAQSALGRASLAETVLYEFHAGVLGGFAGVMREFPGSPTLASRRSN